MTRVLSAAIGEEKMCKVIEIDGKKYSVDDNWTPSRIRDAEQEIYWLKMALSNYMTDAQIEQVMHPKGKPIEEVPELVEHFKKSSN